MIFILFNFTQRFAIIKVSHSHATLPFFYFGSVLKCTHVYQGKKYNVLWIDVSVVVVVKHESTLTLKSMYPFLSMSKVLKTWSQNSSAFPDGKNILYISTNLAGVRRPLGQSLWKYKKIFFLSFRNDDSVIYFKWYLLHISEWSFAWLISRKFNV